MADQKVKVYDGTDWVDLKADDPKLPIYDSTDPAKVDGTDYGQTVELSAPNDFQFAISTRDPTNTSELDFVTRLLVAHTGAFFYLNVSTDQVNTNVVSVKDDEDLTIYGFQTDDTKKQVLLKSRDGVSGTDSYEPTDNDSLVPKSYVDNKALGTHELPITDGRTPVTVILASPSENTFAISTAGVDNRLAVNGRGMVGIGNAGSNPICLYVNSVPTNATGLSGITCSPEIITADADEVSAVKTQANLGAAVAADFFYHFVTGSSTGTGTAATMNGVRIVDTSLTGTTKNVAFSTNIAVDGEKNFSVETGTAPSTFNGDVRTSKVVGTAFSTDASIGLGTNFTVSTGGAARIYVRNDGNIGHGYFGQPNVNFASYMGFGSATVEEMGFLAAPKFDSQPSTSMVAFESQPEFGEGIKATKLTHFRANDSRSTNKPLDVVQRGFYTQGLTLSTVGNRGFEANENIEIGKANYSFVAGGTAPSIFNGDVQVNKLVGADNPATNASVELGANVIVSTGAFYLNVGNPAKNITIGDNTSGVAGGDGVYILSRSHDLAFSSNEIRFNSNWTDGASEPTWVMTEDSGFVGNNNFNYIKCGSISGTISDDASVELDAVLTINVSNQEFVFGGYDADYTGGTLCGLGASSNYIWSKAASGFAIGSDRIAFNSNTGSGPVGCNWSMETDGAFVGATGSSIETAKISAGRNEIGDASIELGADVTVSTNGQATLQKNDGSAYTATSSDSLMTKGNVEDLLTGGGGGGNDGGQLPGSGSNFIWQKVQIFEEYKVDGVTQPHQTYKSLVACDGIFTDGLHWSTDGENWRTIDSSLNSGIWSAQPDAGDRVVKSYDENLYFYESHFSYDMKNWNRINTTVYSPFYFDGHVLSNNGQSYFDPTINTMRSTADLYGKQPDIPDGMTTTYQLWGPAAGEKEGRTAFTIARHNNSGIDQLLMLRKDQTGNADWGWEVVDLPGGEVPLQVLCTEGDNPRFWVFTGQKVYVSSVLTPTTFQPHDLPVNALWDLACHDGISFTIVSTTGDVSAFSSDGFTWHLSNNFQNINDSKIRLAGTNGRTIYGLDYGISDPVTDPDTNSVISYWVTEYLRSGVGTVGDETLIIGGGSLAQTSSVYLAEPIDTAQNNQASGFPTWRTAPPDYNLAPEPAVLRTQEQTNSYFNNKISITRHDQNALKEAVSDNTDEIAKRAVVVTLTQAAYDAIPADEIEDDTLYLITS